MMNEYGTADDEAEEEREPSPVPDKLKKCVTNFSLYAQLMAKVGDPFEDLANNKPPLSKSTKKRLRKQRKKRLALKVDTIKVKKVKKQTKKDIKLIMKKLSKI